MSLRQTAPQNRRSSRSNRLSFSARLSISGKRNSFVWRPAHGGGNKGEVLSAQLKTFDAVEAHLQASSTLSARRKSTYLKNQKYHLIDQKSTRGGAGIGAGAGAGAGVHGDPTVAPEGIEQTESKTRRWSQGVRESLRAFRDGPNEAETYWTTKGEDVKAPRGMIHPNNSYLGMWTTYILVCLIWVALLLPVDLCFDLSGTVSQSETAFGMCELVIDISFWLDLVTNFFVGYRQFQHSKNAYSIEFRPLKVAARYLKGWFLIDFCACLSSLNISDLPFFAKLARMPRLLRMLKMVRLLRLLKLAKIKSEFKDQRRLSLLGDFRSLSRSGLIQVFKIFGCLCLVAHWSGTIWYLIAAFYWDFDEARSIDCNRDANWVKARGLCDETSDVLMYLSAVYWAFSTLSTVGYGDISATNSKELGFSLIMMLFGVGFYSAISGSVVGMISRFNESVKIMNDKRDRLVKFCNDHRLPKPLTRKLFDHLEFSFHNLEIGETMSFELDELMLDLGPELRQETILHLHSDLISQMSFFGGKTNDFIVMVVTDLRPRIAYPDDIIIRKGDRADAMYFVNKGKVLILRSGDKGGRILCELEPGQYFGEIGCLLNNNRLNTVVAAELTELYSLGRKRVLEIMAEFPAWADEVRQSALERLSNQEMLTAHQDVVQQIGTEVTRKGSDDDKSETNDVRAAMAMATELHAAKNSLSGGLVNKLEPLGSSLNPSVESLTMAMKLSEQRILDQLERMQQTQLGTVKQLSHLQERQDTLSKQFLAINKAEN